MGGDFTEPPSQDWTGATADLFDHNGVAIPWQTTQTLLGAHSFVVIDPDGVETTSAITVTVSPGDATPDGSPEGTPASGGAAVPGSGKARDGSLATTGADSTPFILVAVLLLGAGVGLVVNRQPPFQLCRITSSRG